MRITGTFWLPLLLAGPLFGAGEQSGPQPSRPSVEQIFPQSWTAGDTIEVNILGNFLDGVRNVRFDTDALQATVLRSSFGSARIRLCSAPNARPGLYAATLLTRRGLSNRFHFRLTGWKSVLEVEPNDRAEQATVVAVPASLNGMIRDTADSDAYRFHARAGEVLAFNVLVGRNGYAAGEIGNLTLTLLDSAGVVLDTSFSRFLWDPYVQHKFEAEGDYFAVIDHSRLAVTCFVTECENRLLDESYQLTIGRSPMLWSLWPPAARRGSAIEAALRADFLAPSAPVFFSGRGVSAKITDGSGGLAKLRIQVAPDADPGVHLLTVPDDSGSLFPLAFVVTDQELEIESEPNDTLEKSGALRIPSLILGRMHHTRDVDSFRFQANEGEALTFQISARIFGSEMLDPHLALLAADGDIVSLNDDNPSFRNTRNRDSKLEVSIPNAPNCAKRSDRFYVQVRDNSTHAGESSFYVLNARKHQPSFEVGLTSDRIYIERGGKAEVPVSVRRLEGFADDVTIVARNLPDGVSAKPVVIKAKEAAGKLELTAGENVPEANFRLDIAGVSIIDGREVSLPAVLPQPRMGDGIAYVQTESSDLELSIVPSVLFSLERMRADARDDRVRFSVSANTPANVLVRIRRRPGFTAPIRFAVEGLPSGVILDKQVLTDEDRIAELTLRAGTGARIPLGEYRVVVYGTAEDAGKTSTEATQTFFLRAEP